MACVCLVVNGLRTEKTQNKHNYSYYRNTKGVVKQVLIISSYPKICAISFTNMISYHNLVTTYIQFVQCLLVAMG